MKIGVLGGTFDPIHMGHMAAADEAMSQLGLAEVLFVPAGQPWLKVGSEILPAEHRLEMVRLAIADKACFRLSDIEIKREGPTYTVDTIAELGEQSGGKDELYFIIGRDKLAELPEWRHPERLVEMCRLVAVPRIGCPVPDLDTLEEVFPGVSQRVIMLDRPQVDVSASDIRKRVQQGLSISGLVPEAVERYIKEKGLYRG